MINLDELLSMNKEQYINFLALKDILPIDDIVLYKGIKYQITKEDMKTLNLHRVSMGYEWNYSGPEKKEGDAKEINSMLLAALNCIRTTIENHTKHNCLKYKKVE